jgi:MoaA/NifB/PqqE/SkfB family radical SAM enzyme
MLAKELEIERIAVSTNGSADLAVYEWLLRAGVNDLSISLDACCAEDGDRMAGGVRGAWEHVVENIRALAGRVYMTVGIVLTPFNAAQAERTVALAAGLGVSDIRVIPAAQVGVALPTLQVDQEILSRYPILAYRLGNIERGVPVRGIGPGDCRKCSLVLDDMAVLGCDHFPCVI